MQSHSAQELGDVIAPARPGVPGLGLSPRTAHREASRQPKQKPRAIPRGRLAATISLRVFREHLGRLAARPRPPAPECSLASSRSTLRARAASSMRGGKVKTLRAVRELTSKEQCAPCARTSIAAMKPRRSPRMLRSIVPPASVIAARLCPRAPLARRTAARLLRAGGPRPFAGLRASCGLHSAP
jgi:hypothetical protein